MGEISLFEPLFWLKSLWSEKSVYLYLTEQNMVVKIIQRRMKYYDASILIVWVVVIETFKKLFIDLILIILSQYCAVINFTDSACY